MNFFTISFSFRVQVFKSTTIIIFNRFAINMKTTEVKNQQTWN